MSRDNRIAASLAAFSIAINVGLLAMSGIRHGADTVQFLSGASHLLQGKPLIDKEPSYVGYIGLIAASEQLGAGETGVVAVQIAAAAFAAAAVYFLARSLAGTAAGIVAAVFLAVDWDVTRWHAFVLTDSLYSSAVPIVVYLSWRAVSGSWRWRGPAVGAVSASALLRPNGWLLFPIVITFWIQQSRLDIRLKWAAAAAAVILSSVIVLSVPPIQTALASEHPGQMMRNGIVMSGQPPSWAVPMPTDDQAGLAIYGLRHPFAVAKLGVLRVGFELIHMRPFYSAAHNVAVGVMLALLYPLGFVGALRNRRKPLIWLIAATVGAELGVVAFTFADWDGRFLLHTFSLIVVSAATGAAMLWRLDPGQRAA